MATPSRTARILAAIPLVLLVVWLIVLAKDVWATKVYEDADWIASRVDRVDLYEGHVEPLDLEADDPDADARILVIGSSSVAAPNRRNFTEPLVAHLAREGRTVQVTNIGWDGMTSDDLAVRLDTALAQVDAKGLHFDGVVLYLGHNDVTYTYHSALMMPRFDALIGPAWVAMGEMFGDAEKGHMYWLFAHRRVPKILKLLQEVGWLTLDPEAFEPLLARTTTHYRDVVAAMLDTLAARDLPALLVTPVGNLETEPYGPLSSASAHWQEGMATEDPDVRMQLLLLARDAETFTPDMRAKSPMLNALRDLVEEPKRRDAVDLCDLEVRLPDKNFFMGMDMFIDPVHMSDAGFEVVTEAVSDCLVGGMLAAPAPEEDVAPSVP